MQHIGVEGKFFGVRRILAEIFPNLPEKDFGPLFVRTFSQAFFLLG